MICNHYIENENLYKQATKSVEHLREHQLLADDQALLIESCLRNVCIVLNNSDLGEVPSAEDIITASNIRLALKKSCGGEIK